MEGPMLLYAVPKTSDSAFSILIGMFERGKEILKIFTFP